MPTQSQTTTTTPIAPVYSPEQLAMQNTLYNQFYGNIGYSSPLYGQLMGGYGVPGYAGMPQIGIPEPYREQQELDAATKQYDELEQAMKELDTAYNQGTGALGKLFLAGPHLQKVANLTGKSTQEILSLEYPKWKSDPTSYRNTYVQPYQEKLTYAQEAINKQYAPLIEQQKATQSVQPTEQPPTPVDTSFQEITSQPGLTQAEQIAQAQPQTGSPLQDIQAQSPEQLAQMYNLLQQQGQRGIEDWWGQSQRALEQRGITQRGGYEGSGSMQDLGSLLAEKGRMQQDLGTQLGLSQMQAGLQLPYQQLSALEPVRQFEAGYQLQQQQPWLGYGQSALGSVPWGSTQTTTARTPSAGIMPTAIGTLGSIAGIYGMGQNLGWWGQQGGQSFPTTGYGSWNPNAYDMY